MTYKECYRLLKKASVGPTLQFNSDVQQNSQKTQPTENYMRFTGYYKPEKALLHAGFKREDSNFFQQLGRQLKYFRTEGQPAWSNIQTYTTKLPVLQQTLRIYGQPNKPQHLANKALRLRYIRTQKRRAALAGKRYDPTKYYPIPYGTIVGRPSLDKIPINPTARQYFVLNRNVRANSGQGLQPGQFSATDKSPAVLHEFAHDATPGYRGSKNFKIIQSLFARDVPVMQFYNLKKQFRKNTPRKGLDRGSLAEWDRESWNKVLDFMAKNETQNPGAYTNWVCEAGRCLNQLFNYAGSNGKDFDSLQKQLLPWLIDQGYLYKDKNGYLKIGERIIPGFTHGKGTRSGYGWDTYMSGDFPDFIRLLNYIHRLKLKAYSGKATQQEINQYKEAIRRLQLLGQTADNRSSTQTTTGRTV